MIDDCLDVGGCERCGERKIVDFDESNSSGVVLTAYDGGVISRWQRCNDGTLACLTRSQSAVLDSAYLVAADDAADLRSLPVIVTGNQSPVAIVQFQCRISQCIGDPKLSELRTNGTHNHRLWLGPFNHDSANHHAVARLNKTASTDVAENCSNSRAVGVHIDESNSSGVVLTAYDDVVISR